MSQHIIPYTKARSLVQAYLSEKNINAIQRGISFGGSVETASLKQKPPYVAIPGVRFWLCYDMSANGPQLFAGAEHVTIEYDQIGEFATMKSILKAPTADSMFTYKNADISDKAVDAYLSDAANFKMGVDRVITKDPDPVSGMPGAIKYVDNFLNQFPTQPNGTSYNPIGASFYDDLDFDIDQFLNQKDSKGNTITHARYIFGIENTVADHQYPLRMVLFGVDFDGSTLINQNALILERGWPPRPKI